MNRVDRSARRSRKWYPLAVAVRDIEVAHGIARSDTLDAAARDVANLLD